EDAGKLFAHRLVRQQRGDGGIDAARERADDLAGADLLADGFDGLIAVSGHGPVALETRDFVHEIGDELRAVGRVRHFRVELHAVIFAAVVRDRREGRTGGGADDLEAGRQRRHAVAMAHPDLVARARRPDVLEEGAVLLNFERRAAEFAMVAFLAAPAELRAHGLFAI